MSRLAERFLSDMKGSPIAEQGGNFSVLLFGGMLAGGFPPYMSRYYQFDFGSFLFFSRGRRGKVFFDREIYVNTTRSTFRRSLRYKTITELPEITDTTALTKKIQFLYQRYPPDRIAVLPEGAVRKLVKVVVDSYDQLLAATVFSESLDDSLLEEFYQSIGGDVSVWKDFFHLSTSVGSPSFAQRVDSALLRSRGRPEPYVFQWVFSDYFLAPDLPLVQRSIQDLVVSRGGRARIRRDHDRSVKEIAIQRQRIRRYRSSLTGNIRRLFEFVQLAITTRDLRKEPLQRVITVLSNCARELFRRQGLADEDSPYAHHSELHSGTYRNVAFARTLRERKEGVVLYVRKGTIEFEQTTLDGVERALYRGGRSSVPDAEGIIRGQSAYPGIVRGFVSIMHSQQDFGRFVAGNILVTSMTRPEFLPLVRQCSAIITDEGGITCHAAIVSRELKKPCVIGTKIATKVLKDGDAVEVDAEKGTVRVVKSS